MPPKHTYQQYAEQTLLWLPSDTLQRFQHNLRTQPDRMRSLGWDTAQITYEFNQQGFRSPKFKTTNTVMFLGCSYTCGIGLPYDAVWTTRVAAELGMNQANLGIGGASADTAFRLAQYWIPALRPSLVFMLTPSLQRLEVQTAEGDILDLNPTNYEFMSPHDMYAEWIRCDLNGMAQRDRNLLAVSYICQQVGTRFIHAPVEEVLPACKEDGDRARDLDHHGVTTHARMASWFLRKI